MKSAESFSRKNWKQLMSKNFSLQVEGNNGAIYVAHTLPRWHELAQPVNLNAPMKKLYQFPWIPKNQNSYLESKIRKFRIISQIKFLLWNLLIISTKIKSSKVKKRKESTFCNDISYEILHSEIETEGYSVFIEITIRFFRIILREKWFHVSLDLSTRRIHAYTHTYTLSLFIYLS